MGAVDSNIKTALLESSRRAEQLRLERPPESEIEKADRTRSDVEEMRSKLHMLYTRMLSCVVLPISESGTEAREWASDDFLLLRERCSRCGDHERVTEHQHRAALQFLDSEEGKGALMAVGPLPPRAAPPPALTARARRGSTPGRR